MADYPSLGGFSGRDVQPSFSSIAGASVGIRKPAVEFTPEDFPALGTSTQQPTQNQQRQQQFLLDLRSQSGQQRLPGPNNSVTSQQTREQILMSNLLGGNTNFVASALGEASSSGAGVVSNQQGSMATDASALDSRTTGIVGGAGPLQPLYGNDYGSNNRPDALRLTKQQELQQQKQLHDLQQMHPSQLLQHEQEQQRQDQSKQASQLQADVLQQQHGRLLSATSGLMGAAGLPQAFGQASVESGNGVPMGLRKPAGLDASGMYMDAIGAGQPISAAAVASAMASGMRIPDLSRYGALADPTLQQQHHNLSQPQRQQQNAFDYGTKVGEESSQFQIGANGAGGFGASAPGFHAATSEIPSVGNSTLVSAKDKYGILGLIDVIRMTSDDMSMLALGCDLTSLGLQLNSGESIYGTLMTPFSDDPTAGADPPFSLPSCYGPTHPPPPASRSIAMVGRLSDETLFYIFYAMPRDVMQEAAAQELYNRAWRFHKELKLWLCKDSSLEGGSVLAKGADYERGMYVFFDPSSWSRVKKEWTLYYNQLEERMPIDSSESKREIPESKPASAGDEGSVRALASGVAGMSLANGSAHNSDNSAVGAFASSGKAGSASAGVRMPPMPSHAVGSAAASGASKPWELSGAAHRQ